MNVLAIGCHPDDIEINCAGTLAKCVKRGDNVTVCHVCNGNMGHEVIMPDELREMRIGEAKKAGSLAGIKVVTCDIGDCLAMEGNLEQRNIIVDIIREADPDFIITHAPTDYMPDHVAVSRLVFDASFIASVPHYETNVKKASKVTPIYYMDNLGGLDFLPTEYVDITDEIELKLEMLECHESQLKWMRDHDGIDFADFVRTCAKYRGLQCNSAYAEGFKQCLVYPKILPKRLLP
ncbi:MAG: PIG-L family deacetylase [Clostridia bacterium]|nr:PIG-L family deacetylase [Clostridia bacterium]MBQ6894457.1 PIG-L family deacetylase [Clostridia bacterium]